jgi:hypothetical protein
MTRRWLMTALLAGLVALSMAAPAAAHDEYRIIGTLVTVTPKQLAVKQTKDGKVISMTMDKTAEVKRNGKKVPVAQLRAGLSVVVIACGDSIDKLAVMEVLIMPPPGTK